MDNNTILMIILLCINVMSNMFNTGILTFQVFIKLIKRSTCCGSSIEMKDKSPSFNLDKKKDMDFDIIVERVRKSIEPEKKD